MWLFAVGLYLVHLANKELRLAAIFGFTCGSLILLLGGLIGDWVDRNGRLKGMFVVSVSSCKPFVELIELYINVLGTDVGRRSDISFVKSLLWVEKR